MSTPAKPPQAAQPAPSGVQAWKDALAKHGRDKRNRRGKRAPKPVVGIRVPAPPPGSGNAVSAAPAHWLGRAVAGVL